MASKRFTARIRIDPRQLKWIRTHKDTYKTLAGKLDEIINFYKNEHHEKDQPVDQKQIGLALTYLACSSTMCISIGFRFLNTSL